MKTMLTIAAVLLTAGAVLAGGKGEGKGPCRADLEKFCKEVKPGEGRKMECLRSHEAGLSAECKANLAEKRAERLKKNPCLADREKFCAGKEGKERAACMKGHEKELSEACRAKRAERKADKKKEKPAADAKAAPAPEPGK
jgi:hypothetical protein